MVYQRKKETLPDQRRERQLGMALRIMDRDRRKMWGVLVVAITTVLVRELSGRPKLKVTWKKISAEPAVV